MSARPQPARWLGLSLVVTAFACTGVVDPGSSGEAEPNPDRRLLPGTDSEPSPATVDACSELVVPRAPLRRLTGEQYSYVIQDLLQTEEPPAIELAADERVVGFESNTIALLSELQYEQYLTSAETLAARVAEALDKHVSCELAQEGDACAESFIASFGLRAYRRPLTQMETDRLFAVYAVGKGQDGPSRGIELVVQTMLQSPNFLYVVEDGVDDPPGTGPIPLDDYEIASRLSFFLWDSMPDDALFEAAQRGELGTLEGIERAARRMLGDDKAARAVGSFHLQWLGVNEVTDASKDAWNYPEYDEAILASMRRETELFGDHVVREAEGTLTDLLTATYSFLDEPLAALYGIEPPGEPWARVSLDPAERSGVLTQASVMTQHAGPDSTSPVLRGKLIREMLLCQTVPPPPPTVNDVPPPPSPDVSTRERFAQHRADPGCRSCHQLMDPIGFGFEHYDQFGRFREMEGNVEVDASGEVLGTDDADGTFDGAPELARKLAESQEVEACFAKQWFRFAMRRSESDADDCSLAVADEWLERGSGTIRELLVGITTTDSFRYLARE